MIVNFTERKVKTEGKYKKYTRETIKERRIQPLRII